MDASRRVEEAEREEDEETKGNPGKPGEETRRGSLASRARQHTRVYSVRSLIIFPVAAEGKVAAAGCYYPGGEWKDIVISRSQFSLC